MIIFLSGLIYWIIWSYLNLNIPPTVFVDNNTPYIMSTISQSLAAILALTFTISLIVAQINIRFSYRVITIFFDAYTICYIILFIIAVSLPLWLLLNPTEIGIKCSLILSLICLILLVPYFIRFRILLSSDYLLNRLGTEAHNQLVSRSINTSEKVTKIEDIVMSSFNLMDYATCRNGIYILAALTYTSQNLDYDDSNDMIIELYNRLDNIFLRTINDPEIPKYILSSLMQFGRHAIDNDLKEITEVIIARLTNMGYEAIDKGNENVAEEAVSDISILIGDISKKNWEYLSNIDISGPLTELYFIGSMAIEKNLTDVIGTVISEFRQIIKRGLKNGILLDDNEIIIKYVFKSLQNMGNEMIQGKHAYQKLCVELLIIGTISTIENNIPYQKAVLNILKSIGFTYSSHIDNSQRCIINRLSLYENQYPNFSKYLEDFITIYNNFVIEQN